MAGTSPCNSGVPAGSNPAKCEAALECVRKSVDAGPSTFDTERRFDRNRGEEAAVDQQKDNVGFIFATYLELKVNTRPYLGVN